MSLARPSGSAAPPVRAADSSWFDRALAARRPLVMGILNITPDSFSDGGRFDAPDAARTRASAIQAEGADILDIGAESTRPYGDATPVSAEAEWARLAPVLPAAVGLGIPVSVDTMKAEVAARALEAGAAMLNDVWGLQRDPDMARVAAEHGVPVVVMHNRETVDPDIDIIADIERFFDRSLEIAARAGIRRERLVLDPGIGFGKTPAQSSDRHRPARRVLGVRPAAADRPVAQALHRRGVAGRGRAAARRLARRQSGGGGGGRAHRAGARRVRNRAGAAGGRRP